MGTVVYAPEHGAAQEGVLVSAEGSATEGKVFSFHPSWLQRAPVCAHFSLGDRVQLDVALPSRDRPAAARKCLGAASAGAGVFGVVVGEGVLRDGVHPLLRSFSPRRGFELAVFELAVSVRLLVLALTGVTPPCPCSFPALLSCSATWRWWRWAALRAERSRCTPRTGWCRRSGATC